MWLMRSLGARNRRPLLDPSKHLKMVQDLDLCDRKKECIRNIWLEYAIWWDMRSTQAKRRYDLMRVSIILGSAALPALIAFGEMEAAADHKALVVAFTISVSFLVAVCTGLDGFFNYGEIWREKRAAGEIIKSEGRSFFQLCGAYERFDNHEKAYQQFSDKVEVMIRGEIKDYVLAVTPKAPSNP